ncbi:MAG: 3-deoxy-7-phosphoheptulonate synthase [Acidimicrobiia bacterium]|nr:3-deoxy-7-phosphoheptulonate synthase [Acidimicrobiia bacterium]MDH3470040.1 3-deoxy-7-phosphoheptulonate synthase [Acidimicrobiia bacterium]
MSDKTIVTSTLVDNTHIKQIAALKKPSQLKQEIPNDAQDLVADTRREVADVLHAQDSKRLMVVVGPCSIHDVEVAGEYASKLMSLKEKYSDELLIVMRTYFEKPRTSVGWTGLVYDPHLDGSEDIPTGIEVSRRLLKTINDMGMPCAVELLDPITPQYFADFVSWAAIGARTVESQVHRQLASGMSTPVGFKNSTDGRIDVAVNAMTAAERPHSFFSVNFEGELAMVRTNGNPDTHLVLRGGVGGPNYHADAVNDAVNRGRSNGIRRPVMVDCSHANSGRDHRRQPIVAADVLQQFASGQSGIMGLMVESHINAGRQDWAPEVKLDHGVSITDACIGWEDTELLLEHAARSTAKVS